MKSRAEGYFRSMTGAGKSLSGHEVEAEADRGGDRQGRQNAGKNLSDQEGEAAADHEVVAAMNAKVRDEQFAGEDVGLGGGMETMMMVMKAEMREASVRTLEIGQSGR